MFRSHSKNGQEIIFLNNRNFLCGFFYERTIGTRRTQVNWINDINHLRKVNNKQKMNKNSKTIFQLLFEEQFFLFFKTLVPKKFLKKFALIQGKLFNLVSLDI